MTSADTPAPPAIETVIVPPWRDLGEGFKVRRALPSAQRRMVGPFVFFDQMGPTVFDIGRGLDVRPHPHIGLATMTYLFEGEILHRDSLGSEQPIRPGEVNWMVAGRGIVHSERTAMTVRQTASALFGVQIWVALPRAEEERAPSFAHHTAASLPAFEDAGASWRLIAGRACGERSPVATFSELFLIDLRLTNGSGIDLPREYEERALYPIEGRLEVEGTVFQPGQLVVLKPGAAVTLRAAPSAAAAASSARVLLFGGAPLDAPRYLWWNFVSSSRERIEQAKEDWRAGRFGSVAGDAEFIPLPDGPPLPGAPARPAETETTPPFA